MKAKNKIYNIDKILHDLPDDLSFFYIIINYLIDLDSYIKANKEDHELVIWALTD